MTTYLGNEFYIQTADDKLDSTKLIGGKATQLKNIDKNMVPYWVAITADCPDEVLSKVVEQAYGNLYWQKPTASGLGDTFAVRSSAIAEDGEKQSYAGIFESKLNVPITGIEYAVRQVRDSMYSKRVAAYGNAVTKDPTVKQHEYLGLKTAVIIMPMVDAQISGVLFTKEPLGGTDKMLLEYEAGVGGVVDGTGNSVTYFLDHHEFLLEDGNFFEEEVIDNELTHTHPAQSIRPIWEEAKRLENNYRKPLDIEWAVDKNGKAWVLQVRPITA